MEVFAPKFVQDRLDGFTKDMGICLRVAPHPKRRGRKTHAYFPALASCCATLEYMTALYTGNIERSARTRELEAFANRFMLQPDYADDAIRILHQAFRHAVAHRGIASGVWIDQRPGTGPRRITWRVLADCAKPAIKIRDEKGVLKRDPPWHCAFTHRTYIHLGQLWRDIVAGGLAFGDTLATDQVRQVNFTRCMEFLYPRS